MAEDNDFDEWLDDVETDDDGELDQLNIDALLSAVDDKSDTETTQEASPSELDQTNIDALLGINADTSPAEESEDAELDQDNIDALLNGTDETIQEEEPQTASDDSDELDQDNIDALLGGDDDTKEIEELDQDNIDTLLSGNDEDDELDQDNIDALLSDSDSDDSTTPTEESDELDQDNIDALLGGTDTDDTPAPTEDSDELDQDNIDALLGGADDTPASKQPVSEDEDVDQDDIDALLAQESDEVKDSGDAPKKDDLDELFAEADTPETATPDSNKDVEQDDIDALFNDIDAATTGDSETDTAGEDQSLDELFAEDDGDDETTLSAAETDDTPETAFDSEFDEMDQLFSELEDDNPEDDDPFQAEEIDFAEMLDSPADGEEDEFLSLGDEEEDEDEFAPADDATGNETDINALLTADDDTKASEEKEDDDSKKGLVIPAFISNLNKATLSAIGGTLVLLLIVGIYFMFSGSNEEEIIAHNENITVEEKTPPTASNFIPIAEDSTYTMATQGGELSIELKATDEDDQPLIYQITTQPSHGRLSGTAPNFTYLANNDFPGEDSFEYTVHDGEDTSAAALITITGPNLKAQALAHKIAEESQKKKIVAKEIKPKKPIVLAKNVHFYTDSTTPITVNWRRIWQEANKRDYDPKVHVEIVKIETKGKLAKVTGSSTIFTPDPYSERTDLIFYRFKKNGFRSATKTISIDISLGNPAPEINLANLKHGYFVGQNVVLDTSPSRDNAPQSLQFTWEQISGSPVSMKKQDHGKKMTFVMPSSFYHQENAGLTFKVTATDNTGKTTTKEITTKTISRRQAALWRGNNGGVAEDPAFKGKYFPWPYDE